MEPNPYHAPLFRTYRRCELVQHCVWSEQKTVTMKFAKDMIEAAVPTDDDGTIPDINTPGGPGAAPPGGLSKRGHEFESICLTLDTILEQHFGSRIVLLFTILELHFGTRRSLWRRRWSCTSISGVG